VKVETSKEKGSSITLQALENSGALAAGALSKNKEHYPEISYPKREGGRLTL
jgi:hypothetical protein